MIECSELEKSYKKKCVVDNLSFNIRNGEMRIWTDSKSKARIRVKMDKSKDLGKFMRI